MCNGKSNAGLIERAVSVRPAHVQRVNRKPEQGGLGVRHHGGLN